MESLDIIIPEEMLWLGKTESLSPAGHRSFINSLASSSASSCSTSPLPLGDAAAAGLNQLWSIDEVLSLSCFDDFAEDSGSTTTATLEQQYHEAKLQNAPKYKVEEVLKEEPGEWQGLLPVTSGAVADTECFTSSFFPDPSSVYSLNSIPVNNNNSNIIPLTTTTGTTNPKIIDSDISSNYVADTECLAECFFDEIKTFCSDFAAANYQHLTPPQTPPPSAPVLMQQQQVQQSSNMFANNQYNHQETAMGLPNICHGADAPSMTSSIASPVGLLSSSSSSSLYGQRSNMDLQLQSNDLMDKSFVIAQDEVEQQLDNLDSIEKYIGFKDVLENYVLINTQASGTAVPDASPLLAAPLTPQQVAMSLSGGGSSSTGFAAPRSVQMADDSVDYSDDNATQYSTPSYGHSLASSPSRSGSPMDDMEDMTQDDADWSPASTEVTSTKKRSSSSGSPFKRRPYERGGGELEKKTRKKEQNKNAATRYRQKKKQEVETILEEETRLRKTNKKLTAQFNEGRREMKYLKNLLREMYKQNGILI